MKIFMQYLKEDARGNRTLVDTWEWEADSRSGDYRQIHAFGSVIIYKMLERKAA